jgi:hypothetical protein
MLANKYKEEHHSIDLKQTYLFFNIKHRCALRRKTAIRVSSHTTVKTIELSSNRSQQARAGKKKSEVAIQHGGGSMEY